MRQVTRTFPVPAVVLACSALLCACGGGGGGSGAGGNVQTITFDFPGGKTLALLPSDNAPAAVTSDAMTTVTLSATASSALPVTFSATPSTVCTVDGDTLTQVGAGECKVTATQAGGGGYAPVSQSQLFVIPKYPQSVGMINPGWQPLDATTFTVTAVSSLDQAITFSSTTPAVCTVGTSTGSGATGSGATVSKLDNGQCTIVATQAGAADFDAASASKTIPVGTASAPQLTFASGYQNTGLTTENGSVSTSTGVSIHGWYCGGDPECGSTVDGTSVTIHPANGSADFQSFPTFTHYFRIQTDSPGDIPSWGWYDNLNVMAPGLASLNNKGDTVSGLAIDSQAALMIQLAENPEWFGNSNHDVKVNVILGMFAMKPNSDPTQAAAACNVTLQGVITPTSASATTYALPLKGLQLSEACGLAYTSADVWNLLQLSNISELTFQPSSINLSVPRTDTSGTTYYPTELTVGAITVQ